MCLCHRIKNKFLFMNWCAMRNAQWIIFEKKKKYRKNRLFFLRNLLCIWQSVDQMMILFFPNDTIRSNQNTFIWIWYLSILLFVELFISFSLPILSSFVIWNGKGDYFFFSRGWILLVFYAKQHLRRKNQNWNIKFYLSWIDWLEG